MRKKALFEGAKKGLVYTDGRYFAQIRVALFYNSTLLRRAPIKQILR